ncbi:MAG: hypothetical protein GXO39_04460 [Thermotogae bacterium]|nr:hypothetical protein [Thermotogota bacterium]
MKASILSSRELEVLEHTHLKRIRYAFLDNHDEILEGLNSRLNILSDWYAQFMSTKKKGTKPSDLDTGAERIFHHVFAHVMKHPNSSPIGADLMYETFDAFIHIDIKTISSSNWGDYIGKVVVESNQTSYPVNKYNPEVIPRLRAYYYSKTFRRERRIYYKPTLTYFIYILHKHASREIYSVLLISMPNGQLYPLYKDKILQAGKSKHNIRYAFKNEPRFLMLSTEDNPVFRVEFLIKSRKYSQKKLVGIPETRYKLPTWIEI